MKTQERKCPACSIELLPSLREGVEIDCCPRCGGIWLDHGELLKIILAYPSEAVKKNSKIVQ